jgi:predicted DNA-binding protein with PD1-like motif
MKAMIVVSTLTLALAGLLSAGQTRREVVNASRSPADDARPNSDQVPDVYAVTGRFERIVTLRFKFDTDLLAGLQRMVKQENIRNGVILAGAGSVRGYHIHQVSNRTFPSKNMFEKDPMAPADLISMNGYIINGQIHAHITLANPEKAFGGHLEPDTRVFTFAIVTIGVLDGGVDFSRFDDKTYR